MKISALRGKQFNAYSEEVIDSVQKFVKEVLSISEKHKVERDDTIQFISFLFKTLASDCTFEKFDVR